MYLKESVLNYLIIDSELQKNEWFKDSWVVVYEFGCDM
jgi:hypothetical protein